MDLWARTGCDLAGMVRGRVVSAREVAEAALARLAAVNPALNAVVQEMPEAALAAADAVDRQVAAGQDPGPMAGVPVTVKVIVDQAGCATTNGLALQAGLVAAEDSPVVANLRRAGAVIIGRTNTPAFSLRWFTRNRLHGQTLNPHDPRLTPGGSSGGAGAAVAAGIGAIGHGTDIAGSIRYPAYACGVHGLRPGLGRVPAFNATGGDRHVGAQLMAVSGPIGRTIADLRLALAAMGARDARDPWWTGGAHLAAAAVAPCRVAYCEAPEGMAVAPAVRAALRAAADRLSDAGWQVEVVETPPWREAMAMQLRLWMAEFRRSGGAAVAAEGDPDAAFAYDQLCRISPAVDLAGFMDTLQARARLARLWRVFLDDWPLVLCPVSGELPFSNNRDVASAGDFDAVVEAQLPQIAPPLMGLPGLAVTTGVVDGMPVGVQLLADRGGEDLLLAAGAVIAPDRPVVTPGFGPGGAPLPPPG